MNPPRPATTVLLLRAGTDGLEVFLVQRHRNSGFLPNAWVFPGGRVDDGDRLHGHPAVRGGAQVLAQLGIPAADGVAYLVAGVRETYEECGIWLGSSPPPAALRAPLARRELALPDLLAQTGATIDLDRVAAWSWWVTPELEKRRFDTRFLVVEAEGEVGLHDDVETVASGWFDPRKIMREGTLGAFPLAPPTWWTLRELAEHGSPREVMAAAERRPRTPIQPVMEFAESGMTLLLPGHPRHPQPAVPGLPTEVVLEGDAWVAKTGDVRIPRI